MVYQYDNSPEVYLNVVLELDYIFYARYRVQNQTEFQNGKSITCELKGSTRRACLLGLGCSCSPSDRNGVLRSLRSECTRERYARTCSAADLLRLITADTASSGFLRRPDATSASNVPAVVTSWFPPLLALSCHVRPRPPALRTASVASTANGLVKSMALWRTVLRT